MYLFIAVRVILNNSNLGWSYCSRAGQANYQLSTEEKHFYVKYTIVRLVIHNKFIQHFADDSIACKSTPGLWSIYNCLACGATASDNDQ